MVKILAFIVAVLLCASAFAGDVVYGKVLIRNKRFKVDDNCWVSANTHALEPVRGKKTQFIAHLHKGVGTGDSYMCAEGTVIYVALEKQKQLPEVFENVR